MSKQVSGTKSFGAYVASNVVPRAISDYERLALELSPSLVVTNKSDVLAVGTVAAYFFAMSTLFAGRSDSLAYIESFGRGLLEASLPRGLVPEAHQMWHDRVFEYTLARGDVPLNQALLDAMCLFLCPTIPRDENNPANSLFVRIGAIFTVAAKNGEFHLP